MESIAKLLEDKNHCLEKFYKLNESELMNFVEGKFDNIEEFYQTREYILKMINNIDQLIDESNHYARVAEIDPETKKNILNSMSYKNDLVQKILSQDLQILSVIEKTKSEIIKELKSVKMARKALNGYKSGYEEKGLDEKA